VKRVKHRIVVADGRSPRDGKYIEAVGWHDPLAKEEMQLEMKLDRVQYWLSQGAQMSDKVESLMKRAAPGVLLELRAQRTRQRTRSAKKRRG
jgi:small subunit ribosomal protein S16